MKAVVFAYHDMGCAGLLALLEAGYDIAAIFTHPDAAGENNFFGSVARVDIVRRVDRNAALGGDTRHGAKEVILACGVRMREDGSDIITRFKQGT